MKKILVIILLLVANAALATTYYVSATGSNSNNGTSASTPWQTLSKVQSAGNSGIIRPGDFVMFKKGDSFTGTIMWATVYGGSCPSGTATNPITFGTYGTGAKPIFQASTPNGIFWILGPNYIVINGLNFTDLTFPVTDKINKAPCQNGIRIGEYNGTTSNYCTIKNCDFSNIGGGIVLNGNFNVVDSCSITDLKNVQNTYSTTFPGNDNDYGANSFTITGNDNTITHCYLSGAWAESEDYGWNGGAFEMFDNCNRNKIMYNTIVDCGGISEYGAFAGAATAAENMFAYNKIINCGNLSWVNTNGTFAIQASNIMYYNNVIIENNNSRFSGPNTGAGIVTARVKAKIYPEPDMLAFSGSPAAAVVYNLKNNVFNLTTGGKIVRSSGVAAKTSHQDNIYKFSGGSSANFTLTNSELSTAAAIWTNTVPADPVLWDFSPAAGSPAIDFGQNVGLTKDFAGNPVPSIPNAGILESGSITSPLTTTATANNISCNGGTTIVNVTATGGTPPYTGTGVYEVTAGDYNYVITDAAGVSSMASISISEPTALQATVTAGTITTYGGTTTITATVTGGTATYAYKLDSGLPQSSNIFNGVAAGNHTVMVVDANGCSVTKSLTITQPVEPVNTFFTYDNSTFTITIKANKLGNYRITNASGRVVKKGYYPSGISRINVSNLASGIYQFYSFTTRLNYAFKIMK